MHVAPIDTWLTAYTPSKLLWNGANEAAKSFLSSVEEILRTSGTCLNSSGWGDIITAGNDITLDTVSLIAKAICETAQQIDPSLTPSAPHSEDIFRPDIDAASITALDISAAHANASIVADFNPRNRDTDVKDVIEAATDIMRKDPRRRFINGFTIDNDDMRLWHFSRGHIGISESFKFHSEARPFIQFLLYVLFATATELGYDPTVKRHDGTSYEYQVRGSFYITQGPPISEDANSHIVSRAARVWLVKRMERLADGTCELSEENYVLKDVWLYSDAKLESEIRDDIFERLRQVDTDNNGETNHAEEAKDYFMNFEDNSSWRVMLPGQPDILDISTDIPQDARQTAFIGYKPTPARSGSQNTSTLDVSAPKSRMHVRTVFTEVCQTVYEIRDIRTLLRCLIDIIQALRYLRLAGYVHRDVSGGNCLWYALIGRGKLSDLEYAKIFVELDGHGPRIGTSSFMAVEYQTQEHMFIPPHLIPSLASLIKSGDSALLQRCTFFTFNFYHDLESIFWIYVWFLYYCPPDDLDIESHRQEITESAHQLFDCDSGGNSHRDKILRREHGEVLVATRLRAVYDDQWINLLLGLKVLTDVRDAYKALQSTEPVEVDGLPRRWDTKQFTDVPYDAMQRCFGSLLELMTLDGRGKLKMMDLDDYEKLKDYGDIVVRKPIDVLLEPANKRKTEEVRSLEHLTKRAKD